MSTQKVNGEESPAAPRPSHWYETGEAVIWKEAPIPPVGTPPTGIEVEYNGDGKGYSFKKPLHHDAVNHPTHYCQGKIEVITFIEDQQLPHHEASAVAYICRARHAGHEVQDLRKAIWFLNRRISLLEKGTEAVSK